MTQQHTKGTDRALDRIIVAMKTMPLGTKISGTYRDGYWEVWKQRDDAYLLGIATEDLGWSGREVFDSPSCIAAGWTERDYTGQDRRHYGGALITLEDVRLA